MNHRSLFVRCVAFATVASLVTTSCGGKRGSSQPASSPVSDRVLIQTKGLPAGLDLRVSSGKQGPPSYDRAKLAPAKQLAQADAEALLARTKPLQRDRDDQQAFALRPGSQPAPRTGQTLTGAFPPPPTSLLPPPASDTQGLRVVRWMPEGKVPLAPELSVTFSQPMIAVTSQTDASATTPVKLSPQPKGRWRWIGTRTIVFDPEGRALLLLEKNEDALESLRRAVQLDNSNAQYHMSLGLALHNLKKVDEAALEFRAALKRAPDDAKAHVYLGMALREQGELDESKSYLQKALEIDRDNGRAYFELGLLFNRLGKQSDAEQSLSMAVQKSPNESLFWYAYGEIYRLQERYDEAIGAYRKAVDLEPPAPKAIAKLGAMYVKRKQYEDAEALLIPAIRREPKNHLNYLPLAKAYQEQKKTRDAVAAYQKYLDLAPKDDPDRAKVKDTLQDLKRR